MPGRQDIQHTANIANATGIPELILRTIRKQTNKIEEKRNKRNVHDSYKDQTKWGAEFEELERMLAEQMEQQYQHIIPLSTMIIQDNAKC
jgi:predicted RNA-binding protein with RPS1 domain